MGQLRDRLEKELILKNLRPATRRNYLLYRRKFAGHYRLSCPPPQGAVNSCKNAACRLPARATTMALKYPDEWNFEGFHEMPVDAHREFTELVSKIVKGKSNAKAIYQEFSSAFGGPDGSSSTSWAETDMSSAMSRSTDNAATYVDAFHTAMKAVEKMGVGVPSVRKLNDILSAHDVPLMIEPPELKLREGDIVLVDAEEESEEVLQIGFVQGKEIGRGGFGTVFKVTRKTKLGAYHYAMKVFAPSPFNSNKERAFDRFIRELRSLERLQHRAIIPLLEAGQDKNQVPYILMPLIEGQELDKALAEAEAPMVLQVFDEILNGLEFAHSKNIFHRDLKPSNVLVREVDGQPFILDFGAAFMLDEGETQLTTTLIGTDAYVPEEVRDNPKNRTAQQDVYACGKLLYQVIMGKLPRSDDYQPIAEEYDGFEGFDEVVKKAIAPERKRYKSISDLRAALSELAE